VDIADSEGLEAVSVRRIAAKLGSSPMALYHYVPSKRDLLNLILDASNRQYAGPTDEFTTWRDALGHFARESRCLLKRHPWVAALRAANPEYGPACIEILESLLAGLSHFGLDTRTATRALGVLFVFVNGFVSAETEEVGGDLRKKRQQQAERQPRFSTAVLKTGNFPNVTRFVEMGAEVPDDAGFERALKWILDGIEADLRAQTQNQQSRRRRSA
jgi:AcrR family transcriptional regulator